MLEYRKKSKYHLWMRIREWARIKQLPLRISIKALRTELSEVKEEKNKLLAALAEARRAIQELNRPPEVPKAFDVMTINWTEIGRLKSEGKEIDGQDVLDYLNEARKGVLADLASRPDEQVILITEAYRLWYLEATRLLETRKIKARVKNIEAFEETKKEVKRVKVQAEVEKASRRQLTPEEKLLQSMTALLGSENAARAQLAIMNEAAKGIRK